jgi:predicted RNase H-related nuclease YkuK (DUF458 family)
MFNHEINIDEVVEFTKDLNPNTRIYIGCDSERLMVNGVWWADYITAVVVHINGNSGCKIFGAVQRERDWEHRADRPRMRLMNEVYRVADLYLKLCQVLPYDIDVHLDINPHEMYGSSVVINEAVGYIKGMCGVIPFVKPQAFAASYAADRFKEVVGHRKVA